MVSGMTTAPCAPTGRPARALSCHARPPLAVPSGTFRDSIDTWELLERRPDGGQARTADYLLPSSACTELVGRTGQNRSWAQDPAPPAATQRAPLACDFRVAGQPQTPIHCRYLSGGSTNDLVHGQPDNCDRAVCRTGRVVMCGAPPGCLERSGPAGRRVGTTLAGASGRPPGRSATLVHRRPRVTHDVVAYWFGVSRSSRR